jgi:diguanylate cyclase (GGDEF)-like protein
VALALLCEAGALVWFVDCIATGDFGLAGWLGQVLLSVALAGYGTWLAEHRRRTLYAPLHKLESLLPLIRGGEAPIEELSQVRGRLAPVAAHLRDILHQLRQQQSEINFEIRERIANRTSALERTIGSLRQQATRDPLTRLFNRRAFDEALAGTLARWRADGQPICLLMIDVDHFKLLNDTLGHGAGDELLRSIAQIIRSSIRENDCAFRWGGDEFAVLLDGAEAPAARALADRLMKLGDALGERYHLPSRPGLSIGVASLHDIAEPTPQAIVAAADRLLYEVKANRRACAARLAS